MRFFVLRGKNRRYDDQPGHFLKLFIHRIDHLFGRLLITVDILLKGKLISSCRILRRRKAEITDFLSEEICHLIGTF